MAKFTTVVADDFVGQHSESWHCGTAGPACVGMGSAYCMNMHAVRAWLACALCMADMMG